MKEKLLIFHPIIAPYRIDLINELGQCFDVKLCLTKENLFQQLGIKRIYKERLQLIPKFVISKKVFKIIDVLSQITHIIKSFNPDIILVSEFGFITWFVITYRFFHNSRFKIICMVDESFDMIVHNHYFSHRHKIAQRIIVPLLDDVINDEPRVTQWYKSRFKKGIYFPIVSDDDKYRERLQNSLSISEEYIQTYHLIGKKVLLFVGRLSPEKNIHTAIEAFRRANVPDSVFIIIGDGPEKEKLMNRIAGDKTIFMLGKFEDEALLAWYNVAQVHILPSTQEAFGAVTNEALMAGCWGLISERAGSSCLVQEDVNGNIISPNDIDMMARYIKNAFNLEQSITLPLTLKSNRMITSFREYINTLILSL